MVTAEKTGGITLYDVEFAGTQGEIEVAEDGTVIDVSVVINMTDVPRAAADTIQKHATGAKIGRVEKSDVRAEIKEQGAKSTIVKLATPKVVYEAELIKGKVTAEILVAPDGKVVEAPDWSGKDEKKEENEQADKPKVKK
ncbi:MAG: hypothetical protein IMZ55_16725 [Acidobacteria bacterium]|nr:hypothetical protein [Acidobacteriota bacterium]